MPPVPRPLPPAPFAKRWRNRFLYALRGLRIGVMGQEPFYVHGIATVVVIAAAWWLEVSQTRWLILILCIAAVIAAELFNSAIEHLARAVSREEHPDIRNALDVAAGAVLVVAVGAKLVGVTIFASALFV